jgi:DNA-binding MarR family transcriptional regulator
MGKDEPEFADPIDWVEHYWRKQDLGDPRPFLAMGSVLRLHQLMTAEIDRVLKEYDLTRTSYLVLSTIMLSEHGSRLLSRIATHMLVHPTTVTLVIDKLEQQGLVLRQPHPSDRRATYAKITPAGTALVREATRALDKVGFGLPGLTPAQAGRLTDLLTPLRSAAGDGNSVHVADAGARRARKAG